MLHSWMWSRSVSTGSGLVGRVATVPARRRAFRPDVEACEGRRLLSAAALSPPAAHSGAAAEVAATATATSPLSRYRVFLAAINKGPHAGFSLQGPLVLGWTGRIQVYGFLYPSNGGKRVAVVGIVQGSEVALRFVLPKGGALEVVGSGYLQRVSGGIPGGLSLVGSGHVSGPGRNDTGRWETLAPSKLGTP